MNAHALECLKADIFLTQCDIAFREHTITLYPFNGHCTFCHIELAEDPEVQCMYHTSLLDHCPQCNRKFIGD